MKKLLFILIALLQLKVALAQTFPVRVTPQAIPPYPTNLSGYANSGITNSPLRVQLVLSDVTASSREVRLAVAIEGNGINAISAPVVIGAPTLILDGGIPLNLTISELAPYFEQQNLQGISAVQYNSPLPDGSYRFCFEVFDAFTGNRLSSKNCATIFLINNDPPFLNKPDNQAKISEQNPTNIIFQWTPRHINVPNVSYEFSLVEVWDPYIDPQAIFVASPPLYQEVTTNTSLLYGPVQPLLLPGKRYAWRVRAFATNNGEEVSVFNNNGNSEIFWFDYQASCELPSNIQVQDVSMTNATISWIGHPDHLDYTIKYREAGSDRWYSKTTPRDYVTIDEFKADTVYEYRVVGNCTQNSFGESPVNTFRTLSEELADYASCGIQPDPVDLSNQELLTELFVNDVFTAGDFPVYVKEVSGSTSFTGEGYISTPWLATVRIPVKFENIKINTEMKLVDGFVVTTYDPNWGSIVDGDVIIDTILGDDGDVQVIDVDVDITDIEIDENGDIIIITSDGPLPDTFDGGNDIIFVDNTGEEWHVDADGDVSKGEQAEGGPANSGNTDGVSSGGVNEITAAGITVTFNNTNGFYSFDTVPENAGGSIANEYDKVPISGGGEYNIPYKAIAALPDHPTDFVTAEVAISTNDHSASDIIFKTKEGTKVQATWNRDSTTATLSLKKAFDFAKQQIIATVRPKDSTDKYKVAGAANLWHLANQDVATINVKLISVNGASLSGIGERINKIYNPAGVQFNVTSASPLTVSDTTLDVGDSSLLSQYTEGEKAWISQFKTLPGYQRDTYYLFVTDIPPSDSSTEGFMPLKRQFGFVFSGDDKGRTAAHELGHGVFGLEHPFKKYNTTGTTDLLMDYGTGVRLSHMDWEKMHAPGIQIYWFQGDEDGELDGFCNLKNSKLVEDIKSKKSSGNSYFELKIPEYLETCSSDMVDVKELLICITGDCTETSEVISSTRQIIYFDYYIDNIAYANPIALPKFIEINGYKIPFKVKKISNGKLDLSNLEVSFDLPQSTTNSNIEFTVHFKNFENKSETLFSLSFDQISSIKDIVTLLNHIGFDGKIYKNEIVSKLLNGLSEQGEDCNKIDTYLQYLDEEIIANSNISYDTKIRYIKSLSNCNTTETGSNEEVALLNLIRSITNTNEQKKLLDDLLLDNTLTKLISGIDGDNFRDFVFHMTHLILSHKERPSFAYLSKQDFFDEYGKVKNNHIVLWKEEVFKKDVVWHSYNSSNNNNLEIKYDYDFWFDNTRERLFRTISPYDFIGVDAPYGLTHLGLTSEKDKYFVMPAILFHWMTKENDKEQMWQNIKIGVDAALTLFSLGEYAIAKTTIGKAFAVANIALPSVDILISSSDLKNQQGYEDFIATWNSIYITYAAVSGVRVIYQLSPERFKRFTDFYDTNKSSIKSSISDPSMYNKLDEAVGEVKKIIGADDVLRSLEESISSNLIRRGLSQPKIDDIILNAQIVDEALESGNKFLKLIDDLLAQKSKFKNPEDLADGLDELVKNKGRKADYLDQLNEYEEGLHWLNKGEEVYISRKFGTKNQPSELDVRLDTSKGIVECKRVSGSGNEAVHSNIRKILEKFETEDPKKILLSIRESHKKFIGQIKLEKDAGGVYKNISNAEDFVKQVKSDGLINSNPILGIPIEKLKIVKEWYIVTKNGRFKVTSNDWSKYE